MADETLVCPDCAAHFDPGTIPATPGISEPDPYETTDWTPAWRLRLERSYRTIGKMVVVLVAVYVFILLTGALGTISPVLVVALILFIGAVLIMRTVPRSGERRKR